MAAQFLLLGDIDVRVGDRPVSVGHARQQAVLAVLLVDANRSVSTGHLIERVWSHERLPNDPANALRTYISLLRRALASCEATISRQSSGYRLTVEPAAVDLHQYSHLVTQARTAPDDAAAASLFERALRLWRGEPFAGQDGAWFRSIRSGLIETHWATRSDLVEVNLRLGRHAALVAELTGYAADRPLDERIAGQLMVALYRCGRQADALAEYQRIRRRLADELGTDPGQHLQNLHQALLTADPSLNTSAPGPTPKPRDAKRPPAPASPAPAQLPADVSDFAGRNAELAQLDSIAGGTGTAVVISAVSGTAGVGKTALAVRWAHRVRDRFPHGQLYIDLRGYDPAGPIPPGDALARFLRALGVPGQAIPADVDERAASYRTALDGRRMLLLLDNASSSEQVRALLPGTPSCVVVVTSRDSLAGLVSRHGARRLTLDALPAQDAVTLLGWLIGERVAADPAAAAALARQCAFLPLALRIAAHLSNDRPDVALAEIVRELADGQRRLDLLTADDDPRTAVRTVFSWSYRHLPADAARTFRLLSLHPGTTLDHHAVAALADMEPDKAHEQLKRLTRAHLTHRVSPDRYTMHDLLRAYAAELVAEDGPEQTRRASTALFDHFEHTAAMAMNVLYPAERHRRPQTNAPARPSPALGDREAARSWLDNQWPNLAAVVGHTAEQGWPGHAVRLTLIVARYLENAGHYAEAVVRHEQAIRAADRMDDRGSLSQLLISRAHFFLQQGRNDQAVEDLRQADALAVEVGDRTGQARALGNLGIAYLWLARYADATEHLLRARTAFHEVGDRLGEANTLGSLGHIDLRRGHYDSAAEHLHAALAIVRETGERTSEARILGNLGHICLRQADHNQAAAQLTQALTIFTETNDRNGTARARDGLGEACLGQGRHDEAAAHHQAAIEIFRAIGDLGGEARALRGLGDVQLRRGAHGSAVAHLRRALALAEQVGDRASQARTLNSLGEADHAAADPGQALTHHDTALAHALDIGDRHELARAHAGLARAHHSSGDTERAHHHAQHAAALRAELDLPPEVSRDETTHHA